LLADLSALINLQYFSSLHVRLLQVEDEMGETSRPTTNGRVVAQAVSRRLSTAEAWIRSQRSPCGICCEQRGTGTGFSPSSSVLLRQYISTAAPYSLTYHIGAGQWARYGP
jgi:hypothetical protein